MASERFPSWGVAVLPASPDSDWRQRPSSHPYLKLVFVAEGNVDLELDGDHLTGGAGDLLIIQPGAQHIVRDAPTSPSSTLTAVGVRPQVLESASLTGESLPGGRVSLSSVARERFQRVVERLQGEEDEQNPRSGAMSVALTLRLLHELSSGGAADTLLLSDANTTPLDSGGRVRRYVEELQHSFYEATTIDNAASSLNLSRRRFTQLFREVSGTSWLAHVRALRISHACRLLEGSSRTVLSVAFECGFEDLSTFYRAFKREIGTSPNRWRTQREQTDPNPG